jgi:hypothetical protein
MDKPKNFDIVKIKNNVVKKHSEFIERLGSISDKLEADYMLQVETIYARLNHILLMMKKNDIIDYHTPTFVGGKKELIVYKYGYSNNFKISIDVNQIIIYEDSFKNSSINFVPEKRVFSNALSTDFDWLEFSKELLDYIHKVIYRRQKAIEQSLFMV